MTLEPLLNAPLIIQLHVLCALPALFVGPFALFRKRRDRAHKILGYTWMITMIGVAITGLFIPSDIAVIAWFGPIHLFSFFTLWGIADGLRHIWRKDVIRHKAAMQSVWFGAAGLAGLFTFLPGRRMNATLFGQNEHFGYVLIALGIALLAYLYVRRQQTIRMA